jgi:ribosomal protein S18 acetylase RimI-like enzyme
MDKGFRIRRFQKKDEQAVIRLWVDCELVVPWNNPELDIRRKVEFQPELFFVGELDGRIVASVMAGYEGHRGWINYLAVLPEYRRKGLGEKMMRHAEHVLRDWGAPKINLQIRETNREVIQFYEAIGYKAEPIVNMGFRLSEDPPPAASSGSVDA